MAGDRKHQVMVVGVMTSTLAPIATQNACSFSTAAGSVPAGGVRMHQRFTNSSGSRSPDRSVQCRLLDVPARNARHSANGGPRPRTTAPFHRADIGDDRAGFEMRRNFFRDRPAGADRDAQDHEVGVFHRASAFVSTTRSTIPSSFTRARVAGERAVVTISPASPCARGRTRNRAADQAEADQRDPPE